MDYVAKLGKKYGQHLAMLGLQTWGKLKEGHVIYPHIFLNDTVEGSNEVYPSLCYHDWIKMGGMVKVDSSSRRVNVPASVVQSTEYIELNWGTERKKMSYTAKTGVKWRRLQKI